MIKLWLTLLLSIMALSPCFADIHITGTVKSDKGENIIGVSVRISNAEKEIIGYAITDIQGKYKANIKEQNTAYIELSYSCMGYEKLILKVDLNDCQRPINVQLKEQEFQLDEVVVKAPAIKAMGDTILYNVGSFLSKADRSIEDVIKKLPGIQVENNGRITYHGKAINKFYIEGLDLLGGRYSIATKNISPKDIASVSIYENHQPKQVLKDIKISDRAALNLTLKEKRSIKPIGYAKIGIGYENETNWLGELFGMQISPENQTIVTGKGNNSGLSYTNETQSFIEDLKTETVAYDMFPLVPFGKAQIPTSRYYQNKSATASVNTIFKIKEHLTFSAFADYKKESNDYSNIIVTDYWGIDDKSIRVTENNQSALSSHEANVNFKIENNGSELYLGNELKFNGRFNDNMYNLEKGIDIKQSLNNNDYNVRNNFETIIRTERNIYEIKSLVSISNTPKNFIKATVPSADSLIIKQTAEGLSFHTLESTSFSWLASNVSYFGLNVSFEAFYDQFDSYQIKNEAKEQNVNDNSGYKIITSIEPYYQLKNDHITWKTEVPVRMYNTQFKDISDGEKQALHKPFIDLRSSIYFRLFRHIKTSVSIGRKYTVGGIDDFILNPIYITYRQQNIMGTGFLNVKSNDFITASVNYRNTMEGFFCSLRASHNRISNNKMSTTHVTPEQIIAGNKQENSKGSNTNLFLNASKNVSDWNTTFAITGSTLFMKRMTQRQSDLLHIKNQIYSLGTDIRSTFFDDRLSANFHCFYSRTRQSSDLVTSSTKLNDVTLNMDLSFFPISDLELFYKVYYNKSDITTNVSPQNLFMDGGIRYILNKLNFEIAGKNLANKKVYSYSQLSNYDLYTYSFNLRPIEFLLSVKYSF